MRCLLCKGRGRFVTRKDSYDVIAGHMIGYVQNTCPHCHGTGVEEFTLNRHERIKKVYTDYTNNYEDIFKGRLYERSDIKIIEKL